MRQERTVQASIFDLFAGHEIGRELKAMSAWLDGRRDHVLRNGHIVGQPLGHEILLRTQRCRRCCFCQKRCLPLGRIQSPEHR